MLMGCSDIDSVHFHNTDPLTEIVIKAIGENAADRVLTMIKGFFPKLEISEDKWEFEGELQPMYQCSDSSYDLMIVVAVMTKEFKDLQVSSN